MEFKDLTPEQKSKVRPASSAEELFASLIAVGYDVPRISAASYSEDVLDYILTTKKRPKTESDLRFSWRSIGGPNL